MGNVYSYFLCAENFDSVSFFATRDETESETSLNAFDSKMRITAIFCTHYYKRKLSVKIKV